MGSRLVSAVVVTAFEAPAVYFFIRFWEDGRHGLAVLCLVIGELLETGVSGAAVEARLRRRPLRATPGEPGAAQRHRKWLAAWMGAMSVAEIALWVAWLVVVNATDQWVGLVFLLVLMHLKHQRETSAVRDIPYSSGLFSLRLSSASLMEVLGAAGCLALVRDGRPELAAVALVAGLLIEHIILIDVLLDEIAERDLRLPRVPRARSPAPDFITRVSEYWGGNFPWWWWFVGHVALLRRLFNSAAVNGLIGRVPPRPDPLSTMAPYTSWASLTDRRYSSRHLPPLEPPPRTKPEADDVAELFRREGEMVPCPKSTVLFTCFAQWFVDGFLRTERPDPTRNLPRNTLRNESTHQIDLVQLYGLNDEITEQLRAKHGGRMKCQTLGGEDYPRYLCAGGVCRHEFSKVLPVFGFDGLTPPQKDTVFAMGTDTANLGFMAFNVLFLREHNRIAGELEAAHPDWDDDRLFGTARMILTVILIKLVVDEYINHINGYHFEFALRVPAFARAPWMRPNWMAIEFNLLYRWHSLVPSTFLVGEHRLSVEQTLAASPVLTSVGLGTFMAAMSDQPAGRIGLFNTDPFLVEHAEKPSILQGRTALLDSYNQYRSRLGQPEIKRFDQLSSSRRVRDRLAELYDDVHDVEFYVGLFAEEAGPNSVLPPLMTAMVAFDAFSQVYTNPLVAPQVLTEAAFSRRGLEIIDGTKSISQLVHRNIGEGQRYRISLTRRDYKRV